LKFLKTNKPESLAIMRDYLKKRLRGKYLSVRDEISQI